MNTSNAGFTGNSKGSLGGASAEDLKRGYSVVKDEDDDDQLGLSRMRAMFGPFGDYNPEPDSSIDRDTEKDWGNQND